MSLKVAYKSMLFTFEMQYKNNPFRSIKKGEFFLKIIKREKIMTPILPYDVFPIIIGYLRHDRNTLLSCVLVNRTMSRLGIPLLWKNPFSSDESFNTINNYQSALLMRTYLSCFTEEERKYLMNKGV